MSLNLKFNLDVNNLIDNRIHLEDSIGLLCLTSDGDISLCIDESEISAPCPSLSSEVENNDKVEPYADYQLVGELDDIKEQLEYKFSEMIHKIKFCMVLSELTQNNNLEEVKKQIDNMKQILDVVTTKTDLLDNDLIKEQFINLEKQFINLEKQNKTVCNCSNDDDVFEWEESIYESLEDSKGIFVKINLKGKLERADINSLVIGVTQTSNLKTSLIFSGLCEVKDNGKNLITRRCSVKNGIAIIGTHYNVIRRVNQNTIKIILK